MPFLDEFRASMRRVGEKRVTRTDIAKGAYVPNLAQKAVMSAAGFEPVSHDTGGPIDIRVAGSDQILPTTYYGSVRSGSGREPEIRMGRGIVNWLQEGQTLWLGTDGATVFALKSSLPLISTVDQEQIDEATERLGQFLDPRRVLERARASAGPPGRRETRSTVFERNPWVKEFARQRSGCRCEMPACDYVGFAKLDGTPYIEVHHIQSMASDGFDIIDNVAAICPNCHARVHHAQDLAAIQTRLLTTINVSRCLSPAVFHEIEVIPALKFRDDCRIRRD